MDTPIKNIKRDPLAGNLAIIPVISMLVVTLLVPMLTKWLMEKYNFDLTPYYTTIVSYFFVLIAPLQMGVMTGFLIMDEMDENILTALRVTPLPMIHYAAYRFFMVISLSLLCVLVLMPLTGLVHIPFFKLLPAALSATLSGPVFALIIAAFAGNKVEGFAISKAMGILGVAPVIAYFIKPPWQFLFGIFPTYWPVKAFWAALDGSSDYWIFSLVGIVYLAVILVLLLNRFIRKVY